MPHTPPAFLLPLWNAAADITDWFNWNALSAIGTVGALWFAIVQSSRTARLEAARVDGTLTTLIGLIEPLCDCLPEYVERPSGALNVEEIDDLIFARPMFARAIKGLDELSHADIAQAGVAEWIAALKLVLANIQAQLPRHAAQTIEVGRISDSDARYVWEATGFFRQQRERLRYGSISRAIRRFFRQRY